MISVKEAQAKVIQNILPAKTATLKLCEALGYTISSDILSPIDLPPFNQSAMDGYAFRIEDLSDGNPIHIVGESSAGKGFNKKLKKGEAIRIFTGAEVPSGSDTVVMQEKVFLQDNVLLIEDEKIVSGANVRLKGSQISKDLLAIKRDSIITPSVSGFMASIGISKVEIFSKPRVSIIITGNELQRPGTNLSIGKIFESNSAFLEGALRNMGITPIKIFSVMDNESSILHTFNEAHSISDFVLFTGGISVGDYDFVGKVMETGNVENIFYKVKQRPGKPLFFGIKEGKYIFALPGKPDAVLACFYEYVYPALRKFQGHENPFLKSIFLPLSKPINKKQGLSYFLKGSTDFKTALPPEGHSCGLLNSFTEAIIYIPEEIQSLESGDRVEVHLLP